MRTFLAIIFLNIGRRNTAVKLVGEDEVKRLEEHGLFG